MTGRFNLNRFLQAQKNQYETALNEIKSGRKQGCWMWYIFPQFKGLGYSFESQKYAISCVDEARNYLKHPILGKRILEISHVFLMLQEKSAFEVFGDPDYLKLRSSMTLFSSVQKEEEIFSKVLQKYFDGNCCNKTQSHIQLEL